MPPKPFESGALHGLSVVLRRLNNRKSAYGYGWKYLDYDVSYGMKECSCCGEKFKSWHPRRWAYCYDCNPTTGAERDR